MEDHEEKKVRGLYTKRHYLENNYREAQGKTLSDRFKSDFKCDCIDKSTLRFFQGQTHKSNQNITQVHKNYLTYSMGPSNLLCWAVHFYPVGPLALISRSEILTQNLVIKFE